MPSMTMNDSSMPEMMAGAISGKVTVNMVRSARGARDLGRLLQRGSMLRSADAVNM